jgi:hypothetical protein
MALFFHLIGWIFVGKTAVTIVIVLSPSSELRQPCNLLAHVSQTNPSIDGQVKRFVYGGGPTSLEN